MVETKTSARARRNSRNIIWLCSFVVLSIGGVLGYEAGLTGRLAASLGLVQRAEAATRAAAPLAPEPVVRGLRPRPVTWATPIVGAGFRNIYRVSDGLYRSEQPTREGMRALADLGVRTIVNLREAHPDGDLIVGLPLRQFRVPMHADAPREADLVEALRIVEDAHAPVLVHCHHGADRTGAVVAAYRVAVQGWELEDAIDEMRNGGFHFHERYAEIIKMLRSVDWDEVRSQLGETTSVEH